MKEAAKAPIAAEDLYQLIRQLLTVFSFALSNDVLDECPRLARPSTFFSVRSGHTIYLRCNRASYPVRRPLEIGGSSALPFFHKLGS